jgi:hypothetical protein
MMRKFEIISDDDYDDTITVDFDPSTGCGKAFVTGCETDRECDVYDFKFSLSDYEAFTLYQLPSHDWMLKQSRLSFWRSQEC